MRRLLSIVIAAALLSPALDAQLVPPRPDDYEAILIPLAPPQVEGAAGTRWSYECAALNAGSETLVGYSSPVPADVPLPDIFPAWNGCRLPICSVATQFPPGVSNPFVLGGGADKLGHFGMLLYARKTKAADFRFQLRVKNISQSFSSLGAELQPVPARRLVSGPLHFLNVPADPDHRLTLRVYDPSPIADNAVEVRVVHQVSGAVLQASTHLLRQPENPLTEMYPGFPRHPDFLQLSDFSFGFIPFLRVRIEVTSLTGRPIWAFVSITDNETQEFAVATPYRGD